MPVVFPYAPNAVAIGYLTSIVGRVLVMFLDCSKCAIGAVIIPSMIIHFFPLTTSAVFGNATGGMKKGAVLGEFSTGVVFTLLAGTAYVGLGQLLGLQLHLR